MKITLLFVISLIGIVLLVPISSMGTIELLDKKIESEAALVTEETRENKEDGSTNVDLEIIRELVVDDLIMPEIDEERIEHLMATIQEDGTWPDINYIDVSRNAFEHSRHLDNMLTLSRAYKKPNSENYENPDLKDNIASALDYWLKHDFICDNWWWNQMGTPGRMVNILLLMDDALTEAQKTLAAPIVGRANLDASGARPGGDLIQIAGILGKHGLFERDIEVVNEAVKAMAGEIGFAYERGDPLDVRGLQTDFSFHHRSDRVPYTLTYGRGYARSFADWASKVAGTDFEFPEASIELLVDFFLDGIAKTSAYGMYPDPGALSREITRRGILDAFSPNLAQQLLHATSYREEELEEIIAIRKGEQRAKMTGNTFFWHSEYLSHQRSNYFTSVRMYSSRNHNLDQPHNSEGLLNHHLADGSNFIIRHGEEYAGIFPVWNWQKVPGTTVLQKPSLPDRDEIQKRGLTDFVGGVTDGEYGAVLFDFESPHDPLSARKSWFFFDDEFVALGNGISSDSEHPVATTLNQSLLTGDVSVGSNHTNRIQEKGEHNLSNISWVHHDETAYLFPSPTVVRLENKQISGTWARINDSVWAWELEEEHKDVFTLWLDHGVAPRQASYEYIVVPGIADSQVERYLESSPINIMANTPQLQAVQHKGLQISQVAFYEPGEIEIAGGVVLSAESAGLVMVRASDRGIKEITVSDPGRRLDSFSLKVTSRIEAKGSRWKATWHEEEGHSIITFTLPDGEYAGQSLSAKL
ncbi:MAG: polysaccharide lyase family 8 super-sandwich domain-containing protein [Balneolales bacterium]